MGIFQRGAGRAHRAGPRGAVKRFFRDNGLSVVLLGAFLVFWAGQALTGWRTDADARRQHGEPPIGLSEYLRSGDFWEATAENWESEFFQMSAFVLLTVFLKQKGSPESKSPDGDPDVDRTPTPRPGAPWPVRHGGVVARIYGSSLSICLVGLFLASFAIHAIAGARAYDEEQARHGGEAVSALGYLATSRFWHESFQNWQSEFLSVGALVLLGVWLRQRGSPESKPVDAAHAENEA